MQQLPALRARRRGPDPVAVAAFAVVIRFLGAALSAQEPAQKMRVARVQAAVAAAQADHSLQIAAPPQHLAIAGAQQQLAAAHCEVRSQQATPSTAIATSLDAATASSAAGSTSTSQSQPEDAWLLLAPPAVDACAADEDLLEARHAFEKCQTGISRSADGAVRAEVLAVRDGQRVQLVQRLEAAAQARVHGAGFSQGRELEDAARAADTRAGELMRAVEGASDTVAARTLGCKAPLLRDEASGAAVSTCEAAVRAADEHMHPRAVQETEDAVTRATCEMHTHDLLADGPPSTELASALRSTGDAIASETDFWRGYSATDLFPAQQLLASGRAEASRLVQLAASLRAVLGEVTTLLAEHAAHQEALASGDEVQGLQEKLDQGLAALEAAQHRLEDAAIALKRATKGRRPNGDVAALTAAHVDARDELNRLDQQLHATQENAHGKLALFPELRALLAASIPFELTPIYCDRKLDQCVTRPTTAPRRAHPIDTRTPRLCRYETADGGVFDKRDCRIEAPSNHAVFKARFMGKLVALKEYGTTEQQLRHCYQEAVVLRRVQHPGIVEIQAMFEQESMLYLQFPFYEGGTLSEWVQRQQPDDAAFRALLHLVLEVRPTTTPPITTPPPPPFARAACLAGARAPPRPPSLPPRPEAGEHPHRLGWPSAHRRLRHLVRAALPQSESTGCQIT